MATLIYGTKSGVLQDYCLEQAILAADQAPHQRTLIIVPEQTKLAVEQAYLELAAKPGLMLAEVLSFRRLAWRLLGEVGRQPPASLDKAGQAMLVYNILNRDKAKYQQLAGLAEKPGFINQVTAVLGDLKRYRIQAADLAAAADQIDDRAFAAKSHDLALILAAYAAKTSQDNLTDSEDDLEILALLLEELARQKELVWPLNRLAWLHKADVWICGFAQLRVFTPQEEAIIQALDKICQSLSLTVLADVIPFDKAGLDHGADAYMAGRSTALRLQSILPGLHLIQKDQADTELAGQLRQLLRTGKLADDEQALGQLGLVLAESTDDELAWTAGKVRQLVQLEGYRYQDISIALADPGGATARLRAVFREYGIPLFLDQERPFSNTPFMRFILGLLDTGLSGWSRYSLMAYLRSGLTSLLPGQIDQLENKWLARGLFRQDRLFADQYYEDEQLLAWRDQALLPLRQLLADLASAKKVQGKVQVLREFFASENIAGRLEQRIDELVLADEMDLAVTLARSWNAFDHVLDQLLLLAGELKVSLQHWRDLLFTGMEAAVSGVIPSAIDQVSIADLPRAMLRQTKVLFLVGAGAAQLPPPRPPEGLLKDPDRQKLSQALDLQLPSNLRDKAFADACVLESLLTGPAQQLFITAPLATPAQLVRLLARTFPANVTVLPVEANWGDARLFAPAPAARWLQRQGQPADEKLEKVLAGAGLGRLAPSSFSSQLSPATMAALYPQPQSLSVSQLEKYAACPFSHLAERVLSLRPRPQWQLEVTESGTLLHEILERALILLKNELTGWLQQDQSAEEFWRKWQEKYLGQLLENWFLAAVQAKGLERLLDPGLKASLGRRIRRTVESSLIAIMGHYEADHFAPAEFEWFFGPGSKNQLILPLDQQKKIHLQGLIDRIDRQGVGFRVVDYKSGQRTVDFTALYHGLALQLPVYLAAYAAARQDLSMLDAAWFTVNRPLLSLKNGQLLAEEEIRQNLLKQQKPISLGLSQPDLELLCRHSMGQAARLARQLLQGSFPVRPAKLPGKPAPCEYCAYQAICMFDSQQVPWQRLSRLQGQSDDGKRLTARQVFLEKLRAGEDKL